MSQILNINGQQCGNRQHGAVGENQKDCSQGEIPVLENPQFKKRGGKLQLPQGEKHDAQNPHRQRTEDYR